MKTKILIVPLMAITTAFADIGGKTPPLTNSTSVAVTNSPSIFGETNQLIRSATEAKWLILDVVTKTESLLTNLTTMNLAITNLEALKRELAEADSFLKAANLLNRSALLTYPTEHGFVQIAIIGIGEKATNGVFGAVMSIHYPAHWKLKERKWLTERGQNALEAIFSVKTKEGGVQKFRFTIDLAKPHEGLTSPWRWSFDNQVSFLGYKDTANLCFVPTVIRWVKDPDLTNSTEIKEMEKYYRLLEQKRGK